MDDAYTPDVRCFRKVKKNVDRHLAEYDKHSKGERKNFSNILYAFYSAVPAITRESSEKDYRVPYALLKFFDETEFDPVLYGIPDAENLRKDSAEKLKESVSGLYAEILGYANTHDEEKALEDVLEKVFSIFKKKDISREKVAGMFVAEKLYKVVLNALKQD